MAKTICMCAKEATNIEKMEFREEPDMESKYLLILPNGNIVITEKGEDVCIGNVLENSITQALANRKVTAKPTKKVFDKIRTIIARNTGFLLVIFHGF